MRPLAFLTAAVPLAFGCAQPPVVATGPLPVDAPLEVRLHAPAAGSLIYSVSEPAYVAVFAMTSGEGISLVFPYFASQVHARSSAGLNVESARAAAGRYVTGSRVEHGFALPYADALFVIASKYPLPVEGMVRSPSLLRSLVGADIFHATHMSDMWDALETVLTEGLPEDAWDSDVYLNRRYPFISSAAWLPEEFLRYCSDGRWFYATSLTSHDQCARRTATFATTAPEPPAGKPRLAPPSDPTDLGPFIPMQPPQLGAEDAFAYRSSEGLRRESARRAADARRDESMRATERNRAASVRQAARPADAPRYQAPPPRPIEPRPPQTPPAPEAKRPEPKPDPSGPRALRPDP